jgi:hypothetical protein
MARKTIPTSRTRKLVKPGVGLEFFNAVENMHSMHEAKPILELLTDHEPKWASVGATASWTARALWRF